MVDIRQKHWSLFSGDAAREALSEWDPDTALNLLLNSHRTSCNQFLCLCLEQKDGTRVGAQDVSDPGQQHREQLIELEIREREIADRLKPL